jgi:hypothetical protein
MQQRATNALNRYFDLLGQIDTATANAAAKAAQEQMAQQGVANQAKAYVQNQLDQTTNALQGNISTANAADAAVQKLFQGLETGATPIGSVPTADLGFDPTSLAPQKR